MSDMNRMVVYLDVDDVEPEQLSHVWGVLTRVAEGLALDGHQVGVRLSQWRDDGDLEVVPEPVDDEGTDLR